MIELRDYQKEIIKEVSKSVFFEKIKRLILYAPTGSGKTVMARHMIKGLIDNGYKVLFTVPRRKLAFQTQKSFGFGNLLMGIETQDNGSLCTIATIQTIFARTESKHFDFIFIDEGHYAESSEQIKYIKNTYINSVIICLSATPIDQNGYLIPGYDKIINVVDIPDLINQGHLVDVEVFTSPIKPDLSNVDIVNGDYVQTQAAKKMTEQKVLTNAVDEFQKYWGNLKTLAFACNIDHAEKLKVELSTIAKCGVVHSKMTEQEIENTYDLFDRNEIKILINVDMATFGFDQPDIECLFFARPVKSLRLYKQMIGRGLRTSPNKTKCRIIDCACVVEDNGYPTEKLIIQKKPIVSKRVDALLKVERDISGEITTPLSAERFDYLRKISSLIDLYENKTYLKEQDLIDDIRTFLDKTGFFYWRQNSGVMFKDGRYIHFTDKKGLPDITLLFNGIYYVGIEAKLSRGRLTPDQQKTIPELIGKGCFVFFVENVVDLFEILEWLPTEDLTEINKNKKAIDNFETQKKYFKKHKISL